MLFHGRRLIAHAKVAIPIAAVESPRRRVDRALFPQPAGVRRRPGRNRQLAAQTGLSALLGHRYTVAAAMAQPAGSFSGMQPSASRTSPSDQT
jgi:hypothetical protein